MTEGKLESSRLHSGSAAMPIISISQMIFSFLVGGLMGAVVATMLALTLDGRLADTIELVGGVWLGFALTCAAVMIQNSTSRRKSK